MRTAFSRGAFQGMLSILSLLLVGLAQAAEPAVIARVTFPGEPLKPAFKLTVENVIRAVFREPLMRKASGPEVLHIEILLDRIKFSPGEIDSVFGANLAQTVIAYRRAKGLPLEPVVDETVWNLLHQDPGPLFVDYTITRADTAGPFVEIPTGMVAKSSLKRMSYASVAEMLGEQFHINPKILMVLNPGKVFETGTVITVPNVKTPPPPRPASLCINGTDLTLQGLDAAGHILMSYPVSVGSKRDPLPVGQWQITAVKWNPVYSYDSIHFWDAQGPRPRARIAPGPNNPVGAVWIALTKNHFGIHGTPSPASIGKGQSHGCIRLTNWTAAELASVVGLKLNVVLKAE